MTAAQCEIDLLSEAGKQVIIFTLGCHLSFFNIVSLYLEMKIARALSQWFIFVDAGFRAATILRIRFQDLKIKI